MSWVQKRTRPSAEDCPIILAVAQDIAVAEFLDVHTPALDPP
jgi:hypothetical protein